MNEECNDILSLGENIRDVVGIEIFIDNAVTNRPLAHILAIYVKFIFAIGEMVWSPILPAVVNQLAPDHLRGRYNSASTNTWQIGMIMGPAAAGVLLGAGLWALWISLLFGGLVVLSFFALRLKLPDRPVNEKVG